MATTRWASCQSDGQGNGQNSSAETILVVGAGMAGIAAARHLQDAGYKVVVLEGRDRLGGRIWTSRQWREIPLDLGASWIHGERGNPLTQIANRIGAPRQATDSEDWVLYDVVGNLLGDEVWEQIETYENQAFAAIEQAVRAGQDMSIEAAISAYLDRADIADNNLADNNLADNNLADTDLRRFDFAVHDLIEQAWATDMDQLSVHALDEGEGFEGEDLLLPQGYDALVQHLATGLDIRFGATVTQITYDDAGVTVAARSGSFRADRVIVTLPIGVLKWGGVVFEPPLPLAKQAAIEVLNAGVLNKVCLRFPRVFWQRSPDWISYIPEEKGEFSTWLNLARSTGKPVLAAFNVGSFARSLETRSDSEIVDRAMATLRLLYGKSTPEPLDAQITRWFFDPFARCSYSSPGVGMTAQTRADLAAPLGDRVLFAGEATHSDYPATVHGAYLSGKREAERIFTLTRL